MLKRIVTIDNGGSELRMIANTDGREVTTMEKDIAIIDRDIFRIKDNVDEYDVVDVISAPKEEYAKMYLTGRGFYMYDGVNITMNNQNKKANSLPWYQQVIIALATDAIKAARKNTNNIEMHEDSEGVVEVTIPNFDYVLTTLIPVREHSGEIDYVSKIKENLHGSYEVRFPVINSGINTVKFNLSKDRIGVLPEGVVGLTSMRNIIEPNDYTLIIDMGHVTTDLAICKGMKLLGSSVVSSSFAGGTILKLVGNVIRNHGVTYTDDVAVEALETYKFRIGKKDIDISNEINHVKNVFVSNYIKEEILSQIELAGISASSIQYVVPIGAVLGMKNPMNGKYDILEGIIEECNLTNAEIKVLADDLRYVNINKAADFCDAFAKKV